MCLFAAVNSDFSLLVRPGHKRLLDAVLTPPGVDRLFTCRALPARKCDPPRAGQGPCDGTLAGNHHLYISASGCQAPDPETQTAVDPGKNHLAAGVLTRRGDRGMTSHAAVAVHARRRQVGDVSTTHESGDRSAYPGLVSNEEQGPPIAGRVMAAAGFTAANLVLAQFVVVRIASNLSNPEGPASQDISVPITFLMWIQVGLIGVVLLVSKRTRPYGLGILIGTVGTVVLFLALFYFVIIPDIVE